MIDEGPDRFKKTVVKLCAAPARAKPDWEAIERLFRLGVLSIREIAKQAGISDAAIRQKAKAIGWERDLTQKVAAQVRSDLLRTQVRTPSDAGQVRSEKEIVQHAAATVVEVIRSHRAYLSGAWTIANELRDGLLLVVQTRQTIEAEIIEDTPGTKNGNRRYNMLRAVALPSNVQTFKDLSLAIKNLMSLERQAFGMSDSDDGAPPTRDPEDDRREEAARGATLTERMREVLARRSRDAIET